MKRLITIALLALSSLSAETVYLTPKGKTYHTNRQCMSLAKSQRVLTADDKDAEAHGLHKCGICARRSGGKGKKADNGAWSKESK